MSPWAAKAVGAAGGRPPDLQEVRRAVALLADPAHGVELRALPYGRKTVFPASDVEWICRFCEESRDATGVYYTLNPIPADLGRSARKADVLARRWFFVDVDPVRPAGLEGQSATDTEKAAALELAERVVDALTADGWPLPVTVDSGNGWHLLYRVDLPADEHVRAVYARCLDALAELFDGPAAAVDRKVFDAPRIAKLPGTWARKGTHTDERPHRLCRLHFVPERVEPVTLELLEGLAGLTSEPAPPESPPAATQPEPAPKPDPFRGPARDKGTEAYGRRALEEEVRRVGEAIPGPQEGRNNALNRAAFSLGQLVAGGVLSRIEVEDALRSAAVGSGLGEQETDRTVRSGLEAGMKDPRGVPDRNGTHPQGANQDAPPSGKPAGSVIQRASEIKPQKVEWLWPGRIPLGKLTTFAGVGGLGKTFVLCDITARVTRGLPWPDRPGVDTEAGQVLFVSGEDDPDDTLVPRLIELGADLERVVFLATEVQDRFLLKDLDTLNAALDQAGPGVRFVAIDPPTAYLGGVDDHKNSELRALLSPLKSWAKRRRVALVFNTHVNKGTAGKVDAMARVLGSVAWVNAVRAAHMFAKASDDHTKRLFVGMKMNIGPERKGLAYRIVPASEDLARIEWLGEVDTTADEAVNFASKPRKVVASQWLIERFREQLEWPSDDLFRRAAQDGVSRNAIFEAKEILCLPRARRVCGPGADVTFHWWVPADWPRLTDGPGKEEAV